MLPMTDHPAPPPPVPGQPGTRWSAGAVRELTIGLPEARAALLQAVRALGGTVTTEQYSRLVAERGSRVLGLSHTRTRVPLVVTITLAATDPGCRVDITVEDRWSTGRTRAAAAVYAEAFTEVLALLDERLRRADPAAPAFAPWWRSLPEEQAIAGRSSAGAAARLESALSRGTSRVLDGSRKGGAASDAGVDTVTFVSAGSVAEIAAEVVDGMLTAGRLIAASPGALPVPLATRVQAMVALLEARLADVAAGRVHGDVRMELTRADRPVVAFLLQQAALRDRLPVRLLMTCTTCRLEKIVNPDLTRLRERNKRVKAISRWRRHAVRREVVSAFTLVGGFADKRTSDPDFVCTRCQGTEADERPVTYCPNCGDRRDESVLDTCPNCELDLRSLLPAGPVWVAIEARRSLAAPRPNLSCPRPNLSRRGAPVALRRQPVPAAPAVPAAEVWTAPPANAYAARPAIPNPAQLPPGYYPDPWRRFEMRYWDGTAWTVHVGVGRRPVRRTPKPSADGDQNADREPGGQ